MKFKRSEDNKYRARFTKELKANINSIKDFVFTEDGKFFYCTENNELKQLVNG